MAKIGNKQKSNNQNSDNTSQIKLPTEMSVDEPKQVRNKQKEKKVKQKSEKVKKLKPKTSKVSLLDKLFGKKPVDDDSKPTKKAKRKRVEIDNTQFSTGNNPIEVEQSDAKKYIKTMKDQDDSLHIQVDKELVSNSDYAKILNVNTVMEEFKVDLSSETNNQDLQIDDTEDFILEIDESTFSDVELDLNIEDDTTTVEDDTLVLDLDSLELNFDMEQGNPFENLGLEFDDTLNTPQTTKLNKDNFTPKLNLKAKKAMPEAEKFEKEFEKLDSELDIKGFDNDNTTSNINLDDYRTPNTQFITQPKLKRSSIIDINDLTEEETTTTMVEENEEIISDELEFDLNILDNVEQEVEIKESITLDLDMNNDGNIFMP